MERLSLIEVLETIPDPRKPRGVRHPLTAVLSLTVVALLAGCKSLEAIAQFGRDHGLAFRHALGFTRGDCPTKSCLSKLFRKLDVDAFEAALSRWVLSRQQDDDWPTLAVDGKTLCGSRDGDVPASTCSPPTSPARPPPSPSCGSTARRTSTRRRCGCWGCCRWRARW